MALIASLKKLAAWLLDPSPATATPAHVAAAQVTPVPTIRRHTDDSQWRCVASVMQAAIDKATRARELHEAAAVHIDSATYAFGSLLEELTSVMPVTGVDGWGQKASVHTLASPRGRALAGSAIAA